MLDNGRNYELLVRPRGRTPADEYYHNGAVWIEGREGNNYTVDIRNNTPTRALFIVSVDGLDVIEGQPAGPQSQGYVVGPRETISIPGWKINNQEAAEFFFSRSRDSYVNAIGGTTTNTGVIGAMVFAEYQQPLLKNYYMSPGVTGAVGAGGLAGSALDNNAWVNASLANSIDRRITSAAVQSALASMPMNSIETKTSGGILGQATQQSIVTSSPVTQDVGTGFGQATTWQTHTTQFRRANPNHPDAILALYYNTARNLEKMGIRLRKKRDVSYQANPFPGYSTAGCKPPPGWEG
jgi:hypothetical protein